MTATAACRELAEILAGHRRLEGDPGVGWPELLAVADEHKLLSALWSALRRGGIPELPPSLAADPRAPLALLSNRHAENRRRTTDLRAQLSRILDTLEIAGVDAIPIKGSHTLVADLLPDPAAREMIDLDVLVPSSLATEAETALARIGYVPMPSDPDAEPTDHQLPALGLPGRVGSIELHVEPMVARRRALLGAAEVRERARSVVADHRMERRLPDPTTAATLLIGHAQLQEDGARMLHLPMRALHDLHELGPAFRSSVDWDEVDRRFRRLGPEGRVALAGFAAAADAYLGIGLDVGRRGGRAWLRTAEAANDHRSGADRFRQVLYLPIALRPERMARLHGADHGWALWGARLAHVAGGARRRLRPGGN